MHNPLSHITLLLLGWILYFFIHSATASQRTKQWVVFKWPGFAPKYRLTYNILATVLVIPPAWLMYSYQGSFLIQWQGAALWIANFIAVLAVLAFFWSLHYYDTQEFLGTKQWQHQTKTIDDQSGFRLSPLHRYVRHPLYFLALIVVWTRSMDLARLVSSVAITAYFIVGSRLEEKKLVDLFGETYSKYRQLVPGLFPLPWRYLSRIDADKLTAMNAKKSDPHDS
jgi:hypothetical protein